MFIIENYICLNRQNLKYTEIAFIIYVNVKCYVE
jgi:hypothetical protein